MDVNPSAWSAFDDNEAPSGGSFLDPNSKTQHIGVVENMDAEPTFTEAHRERIRQALHDSQFREVSPMKRQREEAKERAKHSAAPKRTDLNAPCKRWMTEQGWKFERVDTYNHMTQKAGDLLGMFDYLAFDLLAGKTIGVQLTSRSNMSARKSKLRADKRLAWVQACGWRVIVIGIDKGPNGRFRELIADV